MGPTTWGSGTWGQYAPVEATGVSLTSATTTPTITGTCNVTLTGLGTTSATGTAVGTGGQTLTAVGEQLQSNTNTPTSVTGSCVVTATGIGLTSALGDGTSLVTTGFQSGWGRAFNGSTGEVIGWGDNLWGTLQTSYALTGVGATTTTGDIGFVGSVAPTITSAGMSSAVGTVGTSIFVTGVSSAVSIGTYSITADATITVVASSEPELDVSLGTQ